MFSYGYDILVWHLVFFVALTSALVFFPSRSSEYCLNLHIFRFDFYCTCQMR
jgi:hypothetical protein